MEGSFPAEHHGAGCPYAITQINCMIAYTESLLVSFIVTWLCWQWLLGLGVHQSKVVHILVNYGPLLGKGLFSKAVDQVASGNRRGDFFRSESLAVPADHIVY